MKRETVSSVEALGEEGGSVLTSYPSFDAWAEESEGLLADPADDFFASRMWFETAIAHALPPDVVPRLLVCSEAGRAFALLPLQARLSGTGIQSLTNPYSCAFRPLFGRDADTAAAGRLISRLCRAVPTVRLDAIEAEAPGLDGFVRGLREGGLVVQKFDHFGNWYEPVAGLSFDEYMSARPGQLRATLRRKMPRVEATARLEVVSSADEVNPAIATFESVYDRSWKPPEPFPDFNGALMRAAFERGLLRLGVLRLEGRPLAVQFWVVSGRRAMVLKLAHDPAYASLSPGTVLTALMIRDILRSGAVREIDFGRGDDAYKQLWTSQRRQRIGFMISNPRHPMGMGQIGRSWLGSLRRRLRNGAASRRA